MTALNLFTTSPADWMDGAGWSAVEAFETAFEMLGGMLATIFWVIGFIQESVDPKGELRLEVIMRMLIKIVITDALVCGAYSVVTDLFGCVTYIIGESEVSSAKDILPEFPEKLTTAITELGFGGQIVVLVFSLVFVLAMWAAGAAILYTAFIRFFKILIGIPYGAIANATIAGSREMSHSAINYWKFMFTEIMSAVTMIIALKIYSEVVGSGTIAIFEVTDTGMVYVLLFMLQNVFLVFTCSSCIKGAGDLTRRFLA
ncbi:MAG: hypothetical protein LUH14_03965 [Clostridiaceae bacterium]|nr:hypothetical protein [Clostridiaceae bacterium]